MDKLEREAREQEAHLSRLIGGVDKLAAQLPGTPAAGGAVPEPTPDEGPAEALAPQLGRMVLRAFKVVWMLVFAVAAMALVVAVTIEAIKFVADWLST